MKRSGAIILVIGFGGGGEGNEGSRKGRFVESVQGGEDSEDNEAWFCKTRSGEEVTEFGL